MRRGEGRIREPRSAVGLSAGPSLAEAQDRPCLSTFRGGRCADRVCRLASLVVRIDHVIYGTADLHVAAARVEACLGLTAVAGGRHEGLGTHDRIVPLADGSFIGGAELPVHVVDGRAGVSAIRVGERELQTA